MTFCTDHIHHYYHHCFSSNRAEHHIPMTLETAKWENGGQFHCTGGKVRRVRRRRRGRGEAGPITVGGINTKTHMQQKQNGGGVQLSAKLCRVALSFFEN